MHKPPAPLDSIFRRKPVIIATLLACALLPGVVLAQEQVGSSGTEAGRPANIILVFIDDLGAGDLSSYGNDVIETPHMDALASRGVRFTNAYAAAPVCSATRASLMSGAGPWRTGITDFIPGHWRPFAPLRVPKNRTQHLPLEIVTPAESLAKHGYRSAYFGKWHLGGKGFFPEQQGFDESVVRTGGGHFGTRTRPDLGLGKEDELTDALVDKAGAFMEAHRNRPFFLVLSPYMVHIPLQAPADLRKKYATRTRIGEGRIHPTYAAMVEHVDRCVGRLLAQAERLALRDRTWVIVTSDNGGLRRRFDEKGPWVSTNAPLRSEKGTLYEGGIRVPLIVVGPTARPGTRSAEPVVTMDIRATINDIAGADAPSPDGQSLLPVVSGRGGLERDALFWHYPHYHHETPRSAIRHGRFKLIIDWEDDHAELYDLETDPGESRNLARTRPQLATTLRKRLLSELADAARPEPNPDHDPKKAADWGRHPDRR